MKSIRKFLLPLLLLCLTASAAPLKSDWKLCRGATLETRDGKQYLRVVIRPEDIDIVPTGSAAATYSSTTIFSICFFRSVISISFLR